MKYVHLHLTLFAYLIFLPISGFSWMKQIESPVQDTPLPKVFLIGEHEAEYDKLLNNHDALLLTVCDNDMDIAFNKWSSMLREMEAYSDQIGFDLKGVKLWLNVFWEADGRIKHIAYYLKPISKNIDTAELNAFFSSFMRNYQFPLVAKERYSHYGSAAFPQFPLRVSPSSNSNMTKN